MNEESQVRGCYNITFYLHQPGNSVGSPLNQMHRQQLELILTDDLLLQGHWWKEDAAGPFCFTSTEARWLVRGGDRWGRGRKSEGSTADTARKRPERPWTAARTMEVLRRCPPRHCPATSALRSCCFNCRAWAESQRQCERVQLAQPSSTSPLTISSGLT